MNEEYQHKRNNGPIEQEIQLHTCPVDASLLETKEGCEVNARDVNRARARCPLSIKSTTLREASVSNSIEEISLVIPDVSSP